MADLIAREDYALSIGGGGCSSYAANRGVTRARAISMGASVSGSYSDNLLVALKDLYKAGCSSNCTCDTLCVGYGVACNSVCEGYWCSCNGDTCPTYCGSLCYGNNSSCGYCDGYSACNCNNVCAGTCSSLVWCNSHCVSNQSCECDALCDYYNYLAGTGSDLGCGLFLPNCASICQCTGVGCLKNPSMSCSTHTCSDCLLFTCSMFCRCEVLCIPHGPWENRCAVDCSSLCGPNCNNCKCNGDTCGTYCTGNSYNCASHCDGYGGAGCSCWNNTTYTCTCWNLAVYG